MTLPLKLATPETGGRPLPPGPARRAGPPGPTAGEVRGARKTLGLTVEQFALLLGVSPSSVFRYENAGPRLSHQGPASGKLALLAAWLGDARSAEALGTLLDDRARPKTDGLAVLAGLLEAGNVLRQKSARDGAPPGPPPEAEELARLALGALGPLGRPAPPAPPGRPGPADATASDRAPGNPARLEFEARIMEAEARMLEARARKLEARARLDSVRESLAG